MTAMSQPHATLTTNIFNIYTASYKGPIPVDDLRCRLVLEMLFSDRLLVAPPVLLCNPATAALRESAPGFLEHILKHRRLVPVFHRDGKGFTELLPRLHEVKSPSIDMLPNEAIRANARFLDACLKDTERIDKDAKEIRDAKTRVSKEFLNTIGDVMPVLQPHLALLLELLTEEERLNHAIEGRSWYRLASRPRGAPLSIYQRELGEIGAMVYDYAYSCVTGTGLAGHNYARSVRAIAASSRAILRVTEADIEPDLFECRDVRAWIYSRDILLELDCETVVALCNATVSKRREFLDSLATARTPDGLRKAKEALDNYLCALSAELASNVLTRHKRNVVKKNRAQSLLGYMRIADNVVPLLAGSVGASEAVGQYRAGDLLWWIIPAVVGGVGVAKYITGRSVEVMQEKTRALERKCEESRPVDIRIDQGSQGHA